MLTALAPFGPTMAGDVPRYSGSIIRTSGVRLAAPRDELIGCVSTIERELAIREAETMAAMRRTRRHGKMLPHA